MIFNLSALNKISKDLGFDFREDEQDWALEFSDYKRLSEFIEYYKKLINKGTRDEKRAMMSLILASYEDYLYEFDFEKLYWSNIENMLLDEIHIFGDLMEYWSVSGEVEQDKCFKITRLIRNIPR